MEGIPKALEGRDIVARARTGSGKTLAYLLPALHRILSSSNSNASWQALLLVPTRELCEQVKEEAAALAEHLGATVTVTAIAGENAPRAATAATAGQLVVSTPARIATLLKEGGLTQKTLDDNLRTLVLDEADLLLSYGYEEDIKELAPRIPRACQCMLMSATTSDDLDRLTKLVLHNPIALDLLAAGNSGHGEAGGPLGGSDTLAGTAAEITHYRIDLPKACASGGLVGETTEKLLHLLVLLRLGLVQRKVLVFVNSAEMGIRVRLFLEAFGIRASVLSADKPLNSRHHILQEFNKGLFDYLIATDDVHAMEKSVGSTAAGKGTKKVGGKGEKGGGKKRKGGPAKDEEFGVTRGIDFKGVNTVVNFDLPESIKGYVHRVGRTGRAGAAGAAYTLFAPSEMEFAAILERALATAGTATTTSTAELPDITPVNFLSTATAHDADTEERLAEAGQSQSQSQRTVVLTKFEALKQAAVDGLRYRGEDVARSITKNVIKEARTKDLKAELLNSKRLVSFFEDRPADLQLLRHDRYEIFISFYFNILLAVFLDFF